MNLGMLSQDQGMRGWGYSVGKGLEVGSKVCGSSRKPQRFCYLEHQGGR